MVASRRRLGDDSLAPHLLPDDCLLSRHHRRRRITHVRRENLVAPSCDARSGQRILLDLMFEQWILHGRISERSDRRLDGQRLVSPIAGDARWIFGYVVGLVCIGPVLCDGQRQGFKLDLQVVPNELSPNAGYAAALRGGSNMVPSPFMPALQQAATGRDCLPGRTTASH